MQARGVTASAMAAVLTALLATPTAAEPISLRYGFAPGQVWHATQTIERRMRFGEVEESDTGVARIEYRVGEANGEGRLALEATLLSQTTRSGQSPFDFTVIRFRAWVSPRGPVTGASYEIGEADPPDLPGVPPDPVAFRTMLRSVASAWLESIFWFPELPDGPLAPGESFAIERSERIPTAEPGVSMQQTSIRTWTLREVADGRARFDIADASEIETETAQSELEAQRSAVGRAIFDLSLGGWVRSQLRSTHRATWAGAPGIGEGQSTAETVTTIEMAPATNP